MSPVRRPPRSPEGEHPFADLVPPELRRAIVEDWVKPSRPGPTQSSTREGVVMIALHLWSRGRRLWLAEHEVTADEASTLIPRPSEPMRFADWEAFEAVRAAAKVARDAELYG